MTANDVQQIIKILIACSDRLTSRQQDRVKNLARFAPNLNYKQLKLMFRLLIIAGHKPICPACNKPITDVQDFSMDHIFPRTMGGGNNLGNLQPMHKSCNEHKGSQIQNKYFIEYQITTTVRIEFAGYPERKKSKKHRNKEKLKSWQITINHNNGR